MDVLFTGNKPYRANFFDAGADLITPEELVLVDGKTQLVDTGTAVSIPKGYVGLVFSRSGLGSKGIRLKNSVGVIDPCYTDTIKVALEYSNNTRTDVYSTRRLEAGTRIAQLVIVPIVIPRFVSVEADTFQDSRGGFGSSGLTELKAA